MYLEIIKTIDRNTKVKRSFDLYSTWMFISLNNNIYDVKVTTLKYSVTYWSPCINGKFIHKYQIYYFWQSFEVTHRSERRHNSLHVGFEKT